MPTIYRSLLGTYTSAKDATNSLPGVIHSYFYSGSPDLNDIVDGVGVNPSHCFPLLGPLIGCIQAVTGYEMRQIILNTWRGLSVQASNLEDEGDTTDTTHIVLVGCSRGGFACQVLAHILALYGLPPIDEKKADEIETKIRSHNNENINQQPTNLRISVYALDPVGTYGLTGRNPVRFFGFDMTKLPAGVALMYSETRDLFRPTIYTTNVDQDHQDRLRQIWFQGFHADAWSPSRLAIAVAAYILADLEEEQHLQFNYDKLRGIINKPWPDYGENKKAKIWLWNLTKNKSSMERAPAVGHGMVSPHFE